MWYRSYGKRLLDLVLLTGVFIPSIMLAVPLVLVSTIKFRGKVLFKQKRLGYRNQVFTIFKFASLLPENIRYKEEIPLAERQTTWGKFLRDYSLDELPQLLNILKGEMSFIGPRPLLPEYRALYSFEEAKRHEVKPGLSGLAQVSGRNELSWEEKMACDQHYVACLSFKLDMKILFSTFSVIIKGQEVNYGREPKPELLKWLKA
jgi:lipopolysaccharide/colanic/teichoic acid biosynthesis glycosyltransferase